MSPAPDVARSREDLTSWNQRPLDALIDHCPMTRRGRGRSCEGPIQLMEADHRDVGAALERVRSVTANLSAPPEACTTWRVLCLGLGQLEKRIP